jgi:hypothetical protein
MLALFSIPLNLYEKQIVNAVVGITVIVGLVFAATAISSLLPVFAQTNQMSSAGGSNSSKMNENTTQASALASPITTFSANGDISSLIFVTQKPINATINPSSLSNATKFALSGDWNLTVNTGKVTNFAAKFIKVLNDSSRWHNP